MEVLDSSWHSFANYAQQAIVNLHWTEKVILFLLLSILSIILFNVLVISQQYLIQKKSASINAEIKPLINEFIFFHWKGDESQPDELRIWIQKNSNRQLAKRVLKENLINYYSSLRGEYSERIQWLYQQCNFVESALRKIQSPFVPGGLFK